MKLRLALLVASAAFVTAAPASAAETIKWAHWYDKSVLGSTDRSEVLQVCQSNCNLAPVVNVSNSYVLGFETNSQYQAASFGRNFIPPDTMGAVGKTQYMVTLNGTIGVYDKNTGALQAATSDVSFWAGAGQTGTSGDPRVMYNAAAGRWITLAFGANVADIQIAVSDTDNALGTWKSVKFTGFAGGVADYPTLALDTNAVYIGTNNFTSNFQGTTLNVIPIDSLFNGVAPTVANMKQFVTPYPGVFEDRGYSLQGVNSSTVGSTGTVVAASLFNWDTLTYDINNLSSSSATGATRGAVQFNGESAFVGAGAGRQPADIAANRRIIDTLDDRISSSVYEANGYIYAVHTVNPTGDPAGDYSRVRVVVLDAATKALVSTYDIGSGQYDYYQGSLAVNDKGQLVVGFNRSGLNAADGKIRFSAVILSTLANGQLHQHGGEILLKESLTNDYHNGSAKGQVRAGRQRWGDYSAVSVDPTDPNRFYAIGQFAREYNTPEDGHPGGTGFARWGTWVGVIDVAGVPEPQTWLMLILGFGVVGGAIRRQKRQTRIVYA